MNSHKYFIKAVCVKLFLILGFLPMKAQKVFVCQDTVGYEIRMCQDDSMYCQSEDRRIGFGLNLVYDTDQVDSVVFSKPAHLEILPMGWMEAPSQTQRRYVVPPLREMGMTSSEFTVTGRYGGMTEDVRYTAHFNTKKAAKTYVEKTKKTVSDQKLPLRTFGRNRRVPSLVLNEDESHGDVEWSADSCEVTISLQELFQAVAVDDTRRVLFYWQNYNEDSAAPHASLLPREPVFGTLIQTENGYEYTTYLGTCDATCKAVFNSMTEMEGWYSGIWFILEFSNAEDATTYYKKLQEETSDDTSISLVRNGNALVIFICFPELLTFEETKKKIIRFDLECHRPPLQPDMQEDIKEETENYVAIIDELGISYATIDAFINQHLDLMDSVCVNTRLGVTKAMQLYLNPSELSTLMKMGRMIDTADGGRICLFDNTLPTGIADSLWSKLTRQVDIQPIYDRAFLYNTAKDLPNHISSNSIYEQIRVDESFGIPYNSYLSVRPVSHANENGICINLGMVLLPRTYTVEVTFAPDVVQHTDTLPGRVRFLFHYNEDGSTKMGYYGNQSYAVNFKDNSKNFEIDNNGKCVTIRFDWTAPAMLNTVYFEVDSYTTSTNPRHTYQKDFRLAKISLKPKNTR